MNIKEILFHYFQTLILKVSTAIHSLNSQSFAEKDTNLLSLSQVTKKHRITSHQINLDSISSSFNKLLEYFHISLFLYWLF